MESCKREDCRTEAHCLGKKIGEYYVMHEEKFLSSWLGEDLVGKEERRKKEDKKVREEAKRKRKREDEEKREGEKE